MPSAIDPYPMNWSSTLTHPITWLRWWGYEVLWFFQRGYRGWSDGDCNNLDAYLCHVNIGLLSRLSECHHGTPVHPTRRQKQVGKDGTIFEVPDGYTTGEWQSILSTMIAGFAAQNLLLTLDYMGEGYDWSKLEEDETQLEAVFHAGMKEYTRYFGALWD